MRTLATRIGGAALGSAMALCLGVSAPAAQAGYVVTLEQAGSDVVATGSGAIDLTGLAYYSLGEAFDAMEPSTGVIATGPASAFIDVYTGLTGPTNFGDGGATYASSGSGDSVAIVGDLGFLGVPEGYVSDGALSDTSTYDNQTFSSLGVTPGLYRWTWGSGANQSFTLEVGEVPEPSTWALMLLGFASLGFAGYRKSRTGAALATRAALKPLPVIAPAD
jgi:hypothetical protein